jgi:hypothetical protein
MRNTGLINAKPYIVWINDSSERFLSLKTEFIRYANMMFWAQLSVVNGGTP